jgi:branched-chain amino acid transport system substrate-binding protein
MKKVLFALAALLSLAFVGTACGGDDSPIKIGTLLPMTGTGAVLGIDQLNGALLYFEDEAGGEIAGRKIEIVSEDTAANPETGLPKMRKLVDNDEVAAVIGPVYSSVGFAVRDFAIASGIPQVYPIPGSLKESGDPNRAPNIFRVDFEAEIVPGFFAPSIYNDLGVRKIAWLAFDYSAGHYISGEFLKEFRNLGGEVVSEAFIPLDVADFGPYLARLQPGEVDAIVAFVFAGGAINIMKQAHDFGLTPEVKLIIAGVLDDNLVAAAGDASEGTVTFTHYTPHSDYVTNVNFRRDYEARFGTTPTPWSVDGYLSAKAIGEAIKAVDGKVEDKTKFVAAMQNVDFDSPRGRFRFDKNGLAEVEIFMMKVERVGGTLRVNPGPSIGKFGSEGPVG